MKTQTKIFLTIILVIISQSMVWYMDLNLAKHTIVSAVFVYIIYKIMKNIHQTESEENEGD